MRHLDKKKAKNHADAKKKKKAKNRCRKSI